MQSLGLDDPPSDSSIPLVGEAPPKKKLKLRDPPPQPLASDSLPAPSGLGQETITYSEIKLGLPIKAKKEIKVAYAQHNRMLKPPALDQGLISLLCLAGWLSKVTKAKKN